MIIKKLKLHNWKNFPKCEINLTERCFIVGANASGKSNLIDALRFLRDISKQSGGLQSAVEERGGIKKIRCLAARKKSNIAIEVELGEPDEKENTWRYELDFKNVGGGAVQNYAKINSEKVYSYKEKKYIVERSEDNKNENDDSLKYTHLEQAMASQYFRELRDFFKKIEYLNVIPQMIREAASIANTYTKEDYFGRNFLERLAKMNEKTRKSYFTKINGFLTLSVPQLEELQFVTDDMGIPHLEARYKHWRANAGKQQEMQFSDGTLRLIGFLFALIDNNSLILLEEPEINLHSGIIAQLPEFISKIQRTKKVKGESQILVTTHSYDILSNEGISPEEVLLLENTGEGTTVNRLSDIPELKASIDSGLSIAETVISYTKPKDINKMSQLSISF